MGHSAFPLEWPAGKKREPWNRKPSRFKDLSFAKTRDDLLRACKRLGACDVTLSTNVPLRKDGLPLAGVRAPSDPGVAIYFRLHKWVKGREIGRDYAIACDQYRKVEENMRALVHTLDAMATINRHGSSDLLEQAMSGFAALPPAATEGWWRTLGCRRDCTFDEAKSAYRSCVKLLPHDLSADDSRMTELNLALAEAEREIGSRA